MPNQPDQAVSNQTGPTSRHLGGVRAVALFEAGKGLLALLAGSGLLMLWNSNVQTVGNELLRHLHLNPGRMHDNVLWEALTSTSHDHLHFLAIGVLCYALVRFAEAAGLWLDQRWAEWLGVLSGGIYVPFEVRELLLRPGWISITMLILNVVIVGYLALHLYRRRQAQRGETH
jgi:uncharacterized membrane protein (DUF2068 family)